MRVTRSMLWQVAAVLGIGAILLWVGHNAADNMAARNITFGFSFLAHPAGFDIPFHLESWELTDTYGRALIVSFTNTLLAAALSIMLASALGLGLALMRLSGNPLAVAAGLETLRQLRRPGVYEQLEACTSALVVGLREAADEAGVEFTAGSLGGMFGFFFHPGPVRNFEEAKKANAERFRVFFTSMLEQGVYLAPSPFEAGFVSLAHRPTDLRKTITAARAALRLAARVR